MAFASLGFLFLFLPIALIGYWSMRRWRPGRAALVWLTLVSLAFVGYSRLANLAVLGFSIIVNFTLGRWLVRTAGHPERAFARKRVFLAGLVLNLVALACFKYADFAIENLNVIAHLHFAPWRFALPLGISFFTIQQIAFLVDAYQGVAVESDLLEYSFFASFFPRVISGPIVGLSDTVDQLRRSSEVRLTSRQISSGLCVLAIGLAKKVLIADMLGAAVDEAYLNSKNLTAVEGWVASLGYTFQLYFDFSGYSDIAIGLALLFAFDLPVNFNSPYRATSMIDFWKRWHITLTSFITGYIYTPMLRVFSFVTLPKAMLVTLASMTIAGLWHGASWGFVIFGALHGLGLVVNHVWRRKVKIRIGKPLGWLLTFGLVNLTLVFFRAPRLVDALNVLAAMIGRHGAKLPLSLEGRLGSLRRVGFQFGVVGITTDMLIKAMLALPVCFAVVMLARNTSELQRSFRPTRRSAVAVAVALVFSVLSLTSVGDFLYFNF